MKLFRRLNNYFHFNKQERNGVFVLCLLVFVLFALRLAMPYFYTRQLPISIVAIPTIASNEDEPKYDKPNYNNHTTKLNDNEITKQLFVFNPNTITKNEAITLGFKDKTANILINFRNKGGKFFKPTDLKKLYGLSEQLFEKLLPYVLIPNQYKEFNKDTFENKYPEKKQYEKFTTKKELLELNSADSLSIVYLKGIGPAFTKRILKYRSMLGGFHNINQLKEVYGITDSLFISLSEQISINPKNIDYLPINVIDINTLKKHPYFNYSKAQAVINYRTLHGKLNEINFADVGVFSEEKLKLISPYLLF